MNLNQLRVFHSAAKCRSFTKAANELCLTQPGVSKHIKELEGSFNTKLFDRIGKKVWLTQSGEILFKATMQIFDIIKETELKINDLNGAKIGRIVVNTGYTPGIHILPRIIERFRKKFPSVEVVFDISTSQSILSKVLENSIDIGIVALHYQDERITSIKFFKDELVVVLPRNHALAKKRVINPEELCNQQMLLTKSASASRIEVDEKFSKLGLKLNNTIEFGNPFAIVKAIESGYGISIMSEFAINHEGNKKLITLRKLKNLSFYRNYYIIFNKNKFIHRALNELINALKEWNVPFD
jgi:LysR family transcriptional regulator, transcriptional activator of the cysJI operon